MQIIRASALCLVALAASCSSGAEVRTRGDEDSASRTRAQLAAGPWAGHAGKIPFVVGYDKGAVAAKESGKAPMYFFTATWCGWCEKLGQESFTDPEIVTLIGEHFTPVIVDGDTEKPVMRRYGVSAFPTVVFTDMNGVPIASVAGYQPKDRFLQVVRAAARGRRDTAPEGAASLPSKPAGTETTPETPRSTLGH